METPAAAPTPAPPPEPEYYVPPEADVVAAMPGAGSSPAAEPAIAEEEPEAEAPLLSSLQSTQAVAPVAAAAAVAGRESRVICPECYAPNPPGNGYCQECGSALPVTSTRQAAAAAGQPGQQQTAVLAPEIAAVSAAQPAYPDAVARARADRGEKSFGVADIMAVIAVGASAVAIALSFSLESFWWKKGVDIGMFSHQGAYSPGRADLLGGPGILPYEGVEFFTMGLLVAVGLALALIFLAVRVGRGPMYILSGCILTFPIAYLFFQAILPLRQGGIDIGSAVGLSGIFFGDAANAGVGLPLWIITAAGVLLILAGFLAPPRGWGRLLTFGLCFSIILGAAFFCAACYNWNLFISEPSAALNGAGTLPARTLYTLLL
jgi:ribosomal protein L40E